MDYSPWSSKNLIDRNWLKKFMQVDVDVTYMHTNFGGHGLSGLKFWLLFACLQISHDNYDIFHDNVCFSVYFGDLLKALFVCIISDAD